MASPAFFRVSATRRRAAPALAVCVLIAGCAGEPQGPVEVSATAVAAEQKLQQRLALQEMLKEHARILDVGFAVTEAAADLCPDSVGPGFGVNVATRANFSEALRDTATEVLGLTERPQIVHIVPGSPAARAGLAEGDKIVALDGKPVGTDSDSGKDLLARLRAAPMAPVTFSVERAAAPGKPETAQRDIAVTPVKVCGYELYIGRSDSLNAFADGSSVVITQGMMRFASSDDDLALVMGHEMAHNVLKHDQGTPIGSIPGAVVDKVATFLFGIDTKSLFARGGGRHYAQEYEAQADYVGLYIVARAGYAIDGAPDFWRRLAADHPDSITDNLAALHPPSPYRAVALENTIAEIRAKQAKGEALIPRPVTAAADAAPAEDSADAGSEKAALAPAAGGPDLKAASPAAPSR